MSDLVNIVELCKKTFNESTLKNLRNRYSIPVTKITESLEDFRILKSDNKLIPGNTYVCKVPVSSLFCDNTYNRGDELSKNKILNNLEKTKGFSYNHAGVLVAFLRKNGKLVLTQGNHRATMSYLCLGENALVPVSIFVHDTNDEKECVLIESKNFHTDCTYRYNITQSQKFKGGYHSGDESYIDLYELCKSYGISIAKTNHDFDSDCTFESYEYLIRVLKMDNTIDHALSRECLQTLAKNLKPGDRDIKGYVFMGLFNFRKIFDKTINDVFKNNIGTSFDDFVNFIFNERPKKQFSNEMTNQKDITQGVGSIKCGYFFASRFVGYFNQYCRAKNLKISNGRDSSKYCAIADTSDSWTELLNKMNSELRDKAKESAFV